MATLPTAMPFSLLCETVAEMMANAADNGYPLWDWSPDDIVNDMTTYSDDLLACDRDDLERAVEAELHKHRNRT